MPNDIIRLRGEAQPLIWPARTLAPILTDLTAERTKWGGMHTHIQQKQQSSMCGSPPHPAAVRGRGMAEARCATLAARAAEVFARANGLRVRQATSWPWRLLGERPSFWREHERVLDHPQLFAPAAGGRPVLVVVHPYGVLPPELAPESWIVDQLPDSWYRWGGTTAYALRTAAPAEVSL